jgi:triosephosphate isomerase
MRRVFVAGNWKMNLSLRKARELAGTLKAEFGSEERVDLAVCPPFVYLEQVAQVVRGSRIRLGAQDVYLQEKGAFTGEISPGMLLDVGCTWTIVGHSERRHVIGETDELIAAKVKAAVGAGLGVILCVGELLEERKAGRTTQVVRTQVEKGLFGLSAAQMKGVVIAYEPVWAIGTGVNASPADANEVHGFIRGLLAEKFGRQIAEDTTIQYGGSVKPENTVELLSQPHVDGALVGGASLAADSFIGIVRNTIQAKGFADAGKKHGRSGT